MGCWRRDFTPSCFALRCRQRRCSTAVMFRRRYCARSISSEVIRAASTSRPRTPTQAVKSAGVFGAPPPDLPAERGGNGLEYLVRPHLASPRSGEGSELVPPGLLAWRGGDELQDL